MALIQITQETSKTTAVEANVYSAQINTFAVTEAAGAEFSFTVNCNKLYDDAFPQVGVVYAGTGTPYVTVVSRTRFSCVLKVKNIHSSAAFNGSVGIFFKVQPN
ncbi:MAG: hypothetical protein KBC56_07275 [Flavobacterium sp.]|nr:hypothetical protein [Flavobacterium sp.]